MVLSEYFKQLASFTILVVVQSTAILLFKLCQRDGKYTFNPASSVALTEVCKLALAASLHYQYVSSAKKPLFENVNVSGRSARAAELGSTRAHALPPFFSAFFLCPLPFRRPFIFVLRLRILKFLGVVGNLGDGNLGGLPAGASTASPARGRPRLWRVGHAHRLIPHALA